MLQTLCFFIRSNEKNLKCLTTTLNTQLMLLLSENTSTYSCLQNKGAHTQAYPPVMSSEAANTPQSHTFKGIKKQKVKALKSEAELPQSIQHQQLEPSHKEQRVHSDCF